MTTTVEKIHDEYGPMVNDLQRAGVNAVLYRRPPALASFTLAGMPRATGVRLWPGLGTEIEYNTDRKHRQAVLNVHEGSHTLPTRTARVMWHAPSAGHGHQRERHELTCSAATPCAGLRDEVRRALLAIWNLDRGSVEDMTITQEYNNGPSTYSAIFRASGRIVRGPSDNHFLIGIDETAHFVAELPREVASVADAHSVLRPVPARKPGTLRQGEFFLVPVTAAEQTRIDRRLQRSQSILTGGPLERHSTHYADLLLNIRGQLFVTSRVIDTRAGGRHEPVRLNGWYRVVRNREVVAAQQMTMPSRRYWD